VAFAEKKLRDYVRKHLILEFGYNQTIFIPEHTVCENNPYLIKRVHQRYSKNDEKEDEKYATYSIRGSIECSASFNNMFFPFRKIEVTRPSPRSSTTSASCPRSTGSTSSNTQS
jgi:hypothetical protein